MNTEQSASDYVGGRLEMLNIDVVMNILEYVHGYSDGTLINDPSMIRFYYDVEQVWHQIRFLNLKRVITLPEEAMTPIPIIDNDLTEYCNKEFAARQDKSQHYKDVVMVLGLTWDKKIKPSFYAVVEKHNITILQRTNGNADDRKYRHIDSHTV